VQFRFENQILDSDRRELRRGSELVSLEPQVFDLLLYLIQNRDRVISKDDLIASVWGGRIVSDSTLDSRINATRKAVGDSGDEQRLIRTVARRGVRFVCAVDEATKNETSTSPKPATTSPQEVHFCTASVLLTHSPGAALRWSRRPTGSTISNTTGKAQSGATCYTPSPPSTD
jgi:DNA-binding winged helix-turn-helix (wHTH) protein